MILETFRKNHSFTLTSFLWDNAATLIIGAFCVVGVIWICGILGASRDATIFIGAFITTCFLCALIIAFVRRRSFYREVDRCLDALDTALSLPELIACPDFLEGRIAYDAIEYMGTLFGNEFTQSKMAAEEYREYIELWIHEIKTPLAAAKLTVSRMHGSDADRILRELERIDNQVEQALYYARSTAVANDYSLMDIDLFEAVNAACKRNLHFLIEQGVSVKNEVDPHCRVIADKPWVVFMIGQVVVNSAKYGASSIVFTADERDENTIHGCTVLKIVDDGMGIPASDVPRVFDKAFTGSNGRKSVGSTGYGLYLVALMARRLGLDVSIASEEGTGTTFCISFPHDRRILLLGD